MMENIRATYKISLPFNSVSSVTLSPSFDFATDSPSCIVSGETGTGRTTAVLNLNLEDPTLSVIHFLDERNVISPEISLHTAKITYKWNVKLDSGSIETRVDPNINGKGIEVTWIDKTANGEWVTDFKLPLEGSPGPFAADIRVRRQFIF